MADGRDDRNGAGGDRAHEPLVAEREQVLEAAAAAGQHDHVHARARATSPSASPSGRRPRPLDVRLGDEHVRRREAGRERGEHVALRGRVVAGDEADPARKKRQRPLPVGGEKPLGGELALQPLERREVRAEAEALDRQCAQPEVGARGEEVRPSEDVDALAVA